MLAIRLNRTGKKNRASFRVVVQEHTKAPGKRHVEIVGSYDPHKKTTILKKERILYWIGQGAQVSDAVHNMLVREGIVEAKKIAKKMPRPVVKEALTGEVPASENPETPETAATPVAETSIVEVPVAEAVPEIEVVEEKKVAETPAEEAPKV